MRKTKAFTLIELLVVIAIIALLVSILLPSLKQAKDLARDLICKTNLKGISIGVSLYTEDYDGWFTSLPPSFVDPNGAPRWPIWATLLAEFPDQWYFEHLTPVDYMEQSEMFKCPRDDRLTFDWIWLSYGINTVMTQENDDDGGCADYAKGIYNIWKAARPEKLYLIADSGNWSFYKNVDPYKWPERRDPRHGSGMMFVHVLFQDGHIEPLLEDEIYGWVWGRMPWQNNMSLKHSPLPITPYEP